MNDNTGHGHVWERPDGMKARCGGPAICAECAKDKARYDAAQDKDGMSPVVGISLKSSVELAEAAYNSGWKGATLAAARLLAANPSKEGLRLLEQLRALPVDPSPSIEKMRAALE